MEELLQLINDLKRAFESHRHTGLDSLNIDTIANGADVTSASGTLPITHGGTGSTTATAATNALLPSQTSNSGKYLTTDGTNTSWGTGFPSGLLDKGNQSTAVTFDVATSNKQKVTLTGATVTLTVSNASVGEVILLEFIQDGTGGRLVTWFSGITWPGGITPTLTTTASKTDVFGFLCTSAGAYQGFILGQNI